MTYTGMDEKATAKLLREIADQLDSGRAVVTEQELRFKRAVIDTGMTESGWALFAPGDARFDLRLKWEMGPPQS